MAPSRVIRVDEQVWAELQKRARPLEDTPNSVLRRVFDLPEPGAEMDGVDPRVARLLQLLQELTGQTPQACPVRKGYSVLSRNEQAIAYIRPQKERLRIVASREVSVKAGLKDWDRERSVGFFGGPEVRWYIPDGNHTAYQHAAVVLEKLWRAD